MKENKLGMMEIDFQRHEDVVKAESKVEQLLEALPRAAAETPDLTPHSVLLACHDVFGKLVVLIRASVLDAVQQLGEEEWRVGLDEDEVVELQARLSSAVEAVSKARAKVQEATALVRELPSPKYIGRIIDCVDPARIHCNEAQTLVEGVLEDLVGLTVDLDEPEESEPAVARPRIDLGG